MGQQSKITNLNSKISCGGNRIRTYEVIRQQIYSLSQLAALVFPRNINLEFQISVIRKSLPHISDGVRTLKPGIVDTIK
jgi:hypothetical protein